MNKEKKMSNINKKAIQIIKLPWKIITKKQNICIKNNKKKQLIKNKH